MAGAFHIFQSPAQRSNMMRTLHITTLKELRQCVGRAKAEQSDCRFGQAMCNLYRLDESVGDRIYESNDAQYVTMVIYLHQYGERA